MHLDIKNNMVFWEEMNLLENKTFGNLILMNIWKDEFLSTQILLEPKSIY